ncbi:MAG: hypothetical protein MPN21_18300 [Thermoanaerobaculia bacterium]|nr:hypothetical protein [Thermoanaerobaculia bacterium]
MHILLMALYAFMVSSFFALLARRTPKARLRLAMMLFAGLMLGSLALAWLMAPFPTEPPAPIP